MAGGPYTKKDGSKYITWSAKRLHPDRPKVKEYLQTKKTSEAHRRKHRLEELYNAGKHDPWQRLWYENASIRTFVSGSLLNGDISDIRNDISRISLYDAAEEYIAYQTSRPRGWNSELTINRYSGNIRFFVDQIGYEKQVSSITKDHIYKVLYRDTARSDETIKSDRSKLISFFNWCKEKGYIDRVPNIEAPEPQKKIPKFIYKLDFLKTCWKKIEMESGRTELPQHQLRYVLAWQVIAGTGMRPGEARRIPLQDVHGNQLLVGGNHRGKTNKQRMVPLLYEAPSAVSILTDSRYREKDPALRNNNLLLGIGSAQTQKRLNEEFVSCWEAVNPGSEKRTLYNLRDMFAVRFLSDQSQGNQDFRLLQLRNILGHESLTTTEKYLKAVPGRLDLSIPNNTDLLRILSDISSKVPL